MKHRNIRPLDILWQDGIESRAFTGIITGLWEILRLAGIAGQLPIVSRGMVALPSFLYHKDREILHPKIDIEPFLAIARQQSRRLGCLNSASLLNELRDSPNYQNKQRYALIIVKEKIHWSNPDNYSEKGGCAYVGDNAVVSLNPYWRCWIDEEHNFDAFVFATRMVTIHEIGHIFGLGAPLPTTSTGDAHQDSLEAHCKNACVMSLNVDLEFRKSIQDNPLCPSCLEKLRVYFTVTP